MGEGEEEGGEKKKERKKERRDESLAKENLNYKRGDDR